MSTTQIDTQIASLSALLQTMLDNLATWPLAQIGFGTTAALVADSAITTPLGAGDLVRIHDHDGFDLVKVSSGTVHYTAAGGATFRVRMDRTSPLYFGAAGDGSTNDKPALDLAQASDAIDIDLMGRSYAYTGTFTASKPIHNGRIIDSNGTQDFRPLARLDVATNAEALAALTTATEGKLADLEAVAGMISAALSAGLPSVSGRMVVASPNSGTMVSGAWTTRSLTTVDANSITGASLASSRVTLPAGRYQMFAAAQFHNGSSFGVRLRLRDITNSATLVESADVSNQSGGIVNPVVSREFVLAATASIELQYYSSDGETGDGLGRNPALSPPRYAVLELTKIG